MMKILIKGREVRAFHEKENPCGWLDKRSIPFYHKTNTLQYFLDGKGQVTLSTVGEVFKSLAKEYQYTPLPVGTTMVFLSLKGDYVFLTKKNGNTYYFNEEGVWSQKDFIHFLFEHGQNLKPVWGKGVRW